MCKMQMREKGAKNIDKKLSLERLCRDRNRDGIFELLRSPGIDSRAKNIE
jgi:hypothetical protein